jgi:hypothetical protein
MPGTRIELVQPQGPRDFKSKDSEKSRKLSHVYSQYYLIYQLISNNLMLAGAGRHLIMILKISHNLVTLNMCPVGGFSYGTRTV